MVSINIGSGQGITQAIRDKIGAANIKNSDLATWQKVMTEVNNAQQSSANSSIFRSGAKYTTDVNKLGDKSTYQTNFVVNQGTVEIDDSIWNKIQQLLTGNSSTQETKEPSRDKLTPIPNDQTPETVQDNQSESQETKVVAGKILNRSVDGEKQQIAVVKEDGKNVRYAVNDDGTLGDTLAATKTFGNNKYISGDFPPETRILEREVNGKKSQIGIFEDENGNKVRKLVVTDENTGKTTLGENLVTVSTAGRNKYVTESKFNADVKAMLGLGENDEIPPDLKPQYITIAGQECIIIKKDGKTMDSAQLRAYMAEYKQDNSVQDSVSPSAAQNTAEVPTQTPAAASVPVTEKPAVSQAQVEKTDATTGKSDAEVALEEALSEPTPESLNGNIWLKRLNESRDLKSSAPASEQPAVPQAQVEKPDAATVNFDASLDWGGDFRNRPELEPGKTYTVKDPNGGTIEIKLEDGVSKFGIKLHDGMLSRTFYSSEGKKVKEDYTYYDGSTRFSYYVENFGNNGQLISKSEIQCCDANSGFEGFEKSALTYDNNGNCLERVEYDYSMDGLPDGQYKRTTTTTDSNNEVVVREEILTAEE